MKTILSKIVLTVMAAVVAMGAYAQTDYGPKWGPNPEEQLKNVTLYNFFRDSYNNQDYNHAASYLSELLHKAPQAHQNIYINGINIYKDKILKATSVSDKNMFVDSLMMLYDMRIEHFGDSKKRGRPYILTYKAQDYMNFKPADREGIIKHLKEAVEANGDEIELDFLNVYFNELTSEYKADAVEATEYIDEYEKLKKIVEFPDNDDNTQAKTTFEALFISSGAASCENIEKMYADKIKNNPEDADLHKTVAGLLTRQNCKDSDFFGSVAEQFYKLTPSSNTAMILAEYFEAKKEYSKALGYLNAAISQENDPVEKAKLSIRIASNELGAGNARTAAQFARQALEYMPDSGMAYYILAHSYASGVNGCTGFNRQSAFWLVYDTLARARNLLSNDPENPFSLSDIDSQMASYRAGFPTKEECFFRGLEQGTATQVSCGWVSGGTTVRLGR